MGIGGGTTCSKSSCASLTLANSVAHFNALPEAAVKSVACAIRLNKAAGKQSFTNYSLARAVFPTRIKSRPLTVKKTLKPKSSSAPEFDAALNFGWNRTKQADSGLPLEVDKKPEMSRGKILPVRWRIITRRRWMAYTLSS
jgi:hypothetical protein